MFLRFRRSYRRLKVYIIENAWRAGKHRQEIVAYLGSIEAELVPTNAERELDSILARTAFWEDANPKLKHLANRLGPDEKRFRLAVHARIPWPMQPERDRLETLKAEKEIKRVEDEAKAWYGLYEMSSEQIADHERAIESHKQEKSEVVKQATEELQQANMWREKANHMRKRQSGGAT